MEISRIQTTTVYKKIIIGFSILTVLLVGLIAYFSFSKTIITITLAPKEISTTMTAAVKQNLTAEEKLQLSSLPGYLVSTTVSGTKTFTNTNTGGQPVEAQATGKVTIYNNWTTDQPLAATTRLLTPNGLLFRLKNRVDVPAGQAVANVEVYADQPGAAGNIGPTKFTIPGLWPGLQEKIYAESKESMSGGIRQADIITQTQLNEAKRTLIDELVKKAAADLEQTDEVKKNNTTISTQSVATVILSEESSAKNGDEASSFDISLKIKAMAVIFDETQLQAKVLTQLRQEINADEQLVAGGQSTFTYHVQEHDLDNQTASLEATYTAQAVPRLSNPIFNRDKITGKDAQTIKEYFSNFDEVKSVAIKFSPFWVTKAPTLKDHIEIKLQ
jgi:hypothetical protein